jgi:hypothetical protein
MYRPARAAPGRSNIAAARAALDRTETKLPEITRIAEVVAQRHIDGGVIGFPYNYQSLQPELMGRAGSLVHMGFERPWKEDRTDAEKRNDVAIIGWERKPPAGANDLDQLKALKARGAYVLGFGPKDMPELSEHIKLCDAFIDTGLGVDDRAIKLSDGSPAGRLNVFAQTIDGWAFVAELVAALTRKGKMPTMWMAYLYPEALEWGNRLLGHQQFHDELRVPPVPAGELGRSFLRQARYHVRAFRNTQLEGVERAAQLIAEELADGRKTIVAAAGHQPWAYVGFYEDQKWCVRSDVHYNVEDQIESHRAKTPDGALVLRLDYFGFTAGEAQLFQDKHQRVMLVTAPHIDPAFQVTQNLPVFISTLCAFGDACVPVEGYPLKIIPPSGFMQSLAYGCIDCETQERIARQANPTAKADAAPLPERLAGPETAVKPDAKARAEGGLSAAAR